MRGHDPGVGLLPARRKWLAVGLFVIAALAVALLLLPASVLLPVLDLSSLPRGDWTGDDPIFAYYDELNRISIAQNEGFVVLHVEADSRTSELYNGFGIAGEFIVPPRSTLELTWRGTVSGSRASVHLVDASQGRSRPDGGEIYTAAAPPVAEFWQTARVPLSAFTRDAEQPEDAPADGILDTHGISNVEVGFEPGTLAVVEIRSIQFNWEASRGLAYLVILIGSIAGVLLLLHAPRSTAPGQPVTLPGGTTTGMLLYPVVCVVLVASVLTDPHFSLDPIEALAVAGMFVLLAVDEYVRPTSARWRLWHLRYVVLASVVFWIGAGSEPLLPCALLMIALPTAAVNDRRLMLIAAVLPVIAVLLQSPLDDVAAKGLQLACVIAIALGAVGISEAARGSEAGKRHQRTVMMYRGILEQVDDGVVLVDTAGCIELANRGIERQLKVEPGQLHGRTIIDFLSLEKGRTCAIADLPRGGEKTEVTLVNPDTGASREALASVHVLRQAGVSDRLQFVFTDISDRKRMERQLERANERLQRLSETDTLTGLDNRRAIEQVLADEWRRCARTRLPLTLMYIDVDAFKAYNDSFGHQQGDRVLREVADVLSRQVKRPGDRLSRFGGEEFVVVLPDTAVFGIEAFAEAMRAAVEALAISHPGNPAASVVTISIGVAACVPETNDDPGRLLHAADTALYAAKRGGRNGVHIHPGSVLKPPPHE